jgi:hypothetical protein
MPPVPPLPPTSLLPEELDDDVVFVPGGFSPEQCIEAAAESPMKKALKADREVLMIFDNTNACVSSKQPANV